MSDSVADSLLKKGSVKLLRLKIRPDWREKRWCLKWRVGEEAWRDLKA
jgi:hypothetical protein